MDKVERYRTLITHLLSALATALNEHHTAHDSAVRAHCRREWLCRDSGGQNKHVVLCL